MVSITKNLNDAFFKEIYGNEKYSLDIFELVFSPTEFRLFDWNSLKSEATVFLDPGWREKTVDLAFSVDLKDISERKERAKMVFLLEHKSYRDGKLPRQLLEYQARVYAKHSGPVIPIVVYHGRERRWRGPLAFQDSLPGMTAEIRRHFGDNILNFNPRFLNLGELSSWEGRDLITTPILFILSHIWGLDEELLVRFFELCKSTKDEEGRRNLQEMAMDYIHRHDKRKFSWKRLQQIEARVLDEGDQVMPALRYSLELEREEGREEGLTKGRLKGLFEGREEVALRLLQEKVDRETICRCTNLTPERVAELADKVKTDSRG